MKVIPAIDLMSGHVVRLYKGDPKNKTVYSSDPVHVAKQWENAGADMIHIVDLDAAFGRNADNNIDTIKSIAQEVFVPLEVAGGIRDSKKAHDVAEFASKIVIGTVAFNDKKLLEKISGDVGKEKIVISVDHKQGMIFVKGWQQNTGVELIEAIKEFREMGYNEFLLTDVNRDGTLEGPDLVNLKRACAIENVKVIASGGISKLGDVIAVKEINAYGVILGKALYDKKLSIEEAKGIA